MAGFFSNLLGTTQTLFQIGAFLGPQLKLGAGNNLDVRNATDTAFVNVRGLDPVTPDDLTTKRYVDGLVGGANQTIRFAIATATPVNSTSLVPGGARVLDCKVEITAAYTAGSTITVGQAPAALAAFQTATDNNPQAVGTYDVTQDTTPALTPAAVTATITGAPAAGAGFVLVTYATTLP
jgi:hypothetical protein